MTQLQVFTMKDWKTQVLSEEKPVVVDFEAPWCSPLLLQDDALTQLAGEIKSDAKMFKVDITLYPAVAMAYRLMDLPTLSLFYKGELLKSCIGIGRVGEMKKMLSLCLDSYVRS